MDHYKRIDQPSARLIDISRSPLRSRHCRESINTRLPPASLGSFAFQHRRRVQTHGGAFRVRRAQRVREWRAMALAAA